MDETAHSLIFHWLEAWALEAGGIGVGKGMLLVRVRSGPTATNVCSVEVAPGPRTAESAKTLATRIVGEAEAYAAGRGGGVHEFIVEAYRDGVRELVLQRPFRVTLEKAPDLVEAQVTQESLARVLLEQNKALLDHSLKAQRDAFEMLTKTVKPLADALARHEQLAATNFELLKANIDNREGREAAAFVKVRNSDMWQKFLEQAVGLIGPMLVPMIAEFMQKAAQGAQGAQQLPSQATPEIPPYPTNPAGDATYDATYDAQGNVVRMTTAAGGGTS